MAPGSMGGFGRTATRGIAASEVVLPTLSQYDRVTAIGASGPRGDTSEADSSRLPSGTSSGPHVRRRPGADVLVWLSLLRLPSAPRRFRRQLALRDLCADRRRGDRRSADS